jgi:hypothetical protein
MPLSKIGLFGFRVKKFSPRRHEEREVRNFFIRTLHVLRAFVVNEIAMLAPLCPQKNRESVKIKPGSF